MANLVDYNNVNWKDFPNTDTPVTATNLNIMDTGVANCAAAVNSLNSTKQDAANAITTSNIGSQTVTGINDGSYAYTPTTIKSALDTLTTSDADKMGIANDSQYSTNSLLATILHVYGEKYKCFGACGVVGAGDTPDTGEYSILWFGSSGRITVIATNFADRGVWIRRIFNGNWADNEVANNGWKAV